MAKARKEIATAEAPLIVPVWVGPAKLFVWTKGRAYCVGILAVTRTRIALNSASHSFDLPLSELTLEWPRLSAGAACYVTWRDGKCDVSFGKPFPNAPGMTESGLAEAAEGLNALATIANLPEGILMGGEILGKLLKAVGAFETLKAGRVVGERVRAHIAS